MAELKTRWKRDVYTKELGSYVSWPFCFASLLCILLISQNSIWNLLSLSLTHTLFSFFLSHSLSHSTSPQFRQDTTQHNAPNQPTNYITTTYTCVILEYNTTKVQVLGF
ncbi:hypothetical protein VNO80_17191 [Phaseolus coccineus]|uniref:Uncharacterized protein n=1 Tax=Phaseolus coccineus TaxID=3886 RepID=A0AAN9MSQ1_PHACN